VGGAGLCAPGFFLEWVCFAFHEHVHKGSLSRSSSNNHKSRRLDALAAQHSKGLADYSCTKPLKKKMGLAEVKKIKFTE
jgi:hypothetical protein